MRSLLVIAVATALPLIGAAQTTVFHIEGNLPKTVTANKIFLSYREGSKIVLDSAAIQHYKFQFTGNITNPTQASLVYNKAALRKNNPSTPKEQLSFYIGQGHTQVVVTAKLKDAKVSGNKTADDYVRYKKFLAPADEALENVNIKFYSSTPEQQNDTAYVNSLKIERDLHFAKKSALQDSYIKSNPDSYFSALALRDFTLFTFEVDKVEPLFMNLSDQVRQSDVGQVIAQRIQETKQVSVGQQAPDFEQKDPNGKVIKLSDFKGKYVLLDFWASWCLPCRAENPNVKAANEKYYTKNFTVLNVSLDDEKELWLKAIEQDGLVWTQVSDLQGWGNRAARRYYITGVPQNFLIDPTGKIIAINLKGQALLNKLAQIL